MNRRNFLSLFSAGVAGIAIEEAMSQAIPLGRVWSFPKKIVIAKPINAFEFMENYDRSIAFAWEDYERIVKIGSTIRIRFPQRWFVRDHFTAAFLPDNFPLPS